MIVALRVYRTFFIWDGEVEQERRIIDVHARLRMLRTINALFLDPGERQRRTELERIRLVDHRSTPSWIRHQHVRRSQ